MNALQDEIIGAAQDSTLHSCGAALKGRLKSRVVVVRKPRALRQKQRHPKQRLASVPEAAAATTAPNLCARLIALYLKCMVRYANVSFHNASMGLRSRGAALGECTSPWSLKWDDGARQTRRVSSPHLFDCEASTAQSACRCLSVPCRRGRVARLHSTSVRCCQSHALARRLTACSEDGWHDGRMYVVCEQRL